MTEKITSALGGGHDEELHALVDAMVEKAERGEAFAEEDRAFHAALLAYVDNSLIGQLVTAFWDVHSAVLPRLTAGISSSSLVESAEAHGAMLAAAERADDDAYRAAVVAHYRPVAAVLQAAISA